MLLASAAIEYAHWTITSDKVLTIPPEVSINIPGGPHTWIPTEWGDFNDGALTRRIRLLVAGPTAPTPGLARVLPLGQFRTYIRITDIPEKIIRPSNEWLRVG